MRRLRPSLLTTTGCGLLAAGLGKAHACATCFGISDSRLALGMNWGLFSLLFVVVLVLGGIATFFFCLIRRASRLAEAEVFGDSDKAVDRSEARAPELAGTLN